MSALETIQHVVAIVLMLGGVFFLLTGSFGLLRLPDFYTRAHATGKVDTMGIMLLLIGMAVYSGFSLTSAKLLVIFGFVAATSPVATHALLRRALLHGLKPWYRKEKE
jgi:multicomponent Na+:H+ antiporter subunit G